MKIEVLKIQGNAVVHKEFEHRNGRNYLRVKKRPLSSIYNTPLYRTLQHQDSIGM